MEEIEELRAKAIASMASSSSAATTTNQKKSTIPNKEEGELSSSDNDEILTSSSTVNVPTIAAVVATAVTSPPVESNVITPVTIKSNQSSRTGKLTTGIDTASPADIRPKTSANQSKSKPFIRNSVPPKPGNQYSSAWYAPSLPFNNLVISFSDDDSESDSPEQKRDRTSERKEVGAERSTSQMDLEYTPNSAKNQIKRMPKTVSLNRTRTFVSSLTKIHGANSRGSVSSLTEPITHNRNIDNFNTASASQEHEVSSGMNLNKSKLEDLRNQIAIRENQIKLRSVQQSKSTSLGSYDDLSGINQRQIAAKKSRPGGSARLVSNEPEKKRLKLDTSQRKSNPDAQQKVSGPSEFKQRMPPPENIKQKNDGNLMTCRQYPVDVAVGKVDLNAHKQPAKVSSIRGTSGNLIPRTKDGESSRGFLETTSAEMPNSKLPSKNRGYSSDISTSCLQSGKSNMVMDISVPLHQSSSLVQMASREEDRGASQFEISAPTKSKTDSTRISGTLGLLHSSEKDKPAQHNIEQNSEYNEVTLGDRIEGSPKNTSLQDYSGNTDLSEVQRVNIQTLLEMEEAHDKELEEAQDFRYKCELEERNARKAYRESQRALFEANERCTYLYRKRELFSAQFRAFMMEDQSSFSPSVWDKYPKAGNDSFMPEADVDNLPTSGIPKEFEFDIMNHELNSQGTDSAVVHTSSQQLRGHTLVSEPPHEPDASTLELLNVKGNNGVCSPSHRTHISAEEDKEVAQSGRRITQSMIVEKNVENIKNRVQDLNNKSERISSHVNTNDYAVLEASLRSELFARLGTKNVAKNKNLHSEEDHIPNIGDENKNSDTIMSNKQCAVLEEEPTSNIGGTDKMDKSSCWSIQVYKPAPSLGDICSDYQFRRINDPEGSSSLEKASKSISTRSSLPSPSRKLVFSYVRATPLISFRRDQVGAQKKCILDKLHEEESLAHSELLLGVVRTHVRGNVGEVGCYAGNYPIDPLWPVCMFELRGKCNDEECIWQHMKNGSGMNIEQHDCSGSAGCVLGLSSDVKKFSSAHSIARHLQQCVISSPPMYLVGLDLLKADLRASGTVLTQSIGMCWQKGFSTSSSVPFIIQRPHARRGACLGGQGSRKGPLMHFRSHDNSGNDVDDPEQCLDKALAIFGDTNKLEGMAKAQNMLSRAIETNPSSVALWIVYLHIHYRNATTIGKDDLFSHAIHNNEGSYELWLMYINSRAQLEDRVAAYDTALSALCRDASLPDRDRMHASACILDLYLRFVDHLRMSGQVEKVIQRIHRLLRADSADNGLIACLTVEDKCLFYVCCVYLLLYKKLPDPVVAQFEYMKELQFGLEWPSVYLPAAEERRALGLMKMGVDSITSTEGPYEKEACYISLSHVRVIAALEGIETSKIKLNDYIQLYPTCLELALLSARLNDIEGFEHILSNWPKETPGIQCIWNQYSQFALESKGIDFAKQLMVRWFETGKMDVMEDDTDSDPGFTFSNPNDELFGRLNLSVYRLLQNDHVKARSAIDKALEVVSDIEGFLHCVKEHAVFVSSEVLDRTGDDGPSSGILGLLNLYIKDPRALPLSDLLSRKFCQDIRKPRIRKLINNLLGPIPFNCSLLNSVLESWYGPSLLPEEFEDLKDLVDLVETLMELYPANYSLAFTVCKLITARKNTSVSVFFWASTVLVNSIFQAVPVAPESKWVEAAGILSDLREAAQGVSERFYQYGLSIYPFSVKLWKSYYNFGKKTGNGNSVVQAARDRGMKLE